MENFMTYRKLAAQLAGIGRVKTDAAWNCRKTVTPACGSRPLARFAEDLFHR